MAKTPELSQDLGEGSHAVLRAASSNVESYLDSLGIIPIEGSIEERTAALNALIDEKIGVGKSGHTSLTDLLAIGREYGADAVQAVVNAGRLRF